MRTVYTGLFHPGLSSQEGYHGSVTVGDKRFVERRI